MTTILVKRRKLGFVLGTIKKPADGNAEEHEAWLTYHGVVKQWIWSSVSKEIAPQIMYTNDASVIWNDLRDQFSQSNETHIYQLSQDVVMLQQGSDSVSKFCTNLKTIWREIDAYGEATHCNCGACICNINGRINDREDRLKIRKSLTGLRDDFRQIRSHIL